LAEIGGEIYGYIYPYRYPYIYRYRYPYLGVGNADGTGESDGGRRRKFGLCPYIYYLSLLRRDKDIGGEKREGVWGRERRGGPHAPQMDVREGLDTLRGGVV